MDSVEDIVLTAWSGTQEFYASTPEEKFQFMLEFLNCNGVGDETDDLQAAVIRECRRLAFARTIQ